MTSYRAPEIQCVDLFCGVGGLTHGLCRAGIRVVAGVDVDTQCRFAYESNNSAEFCEQDIRLISGNELLQLYSGSALKMLSGCAPCQPFSKYSRRRPLAAAGSMWDLVSEFGRLVREVRPHFVTMENVPQLAQHPVFQELLRDLADYSVSWEVVECSAYGIPQTRKRLVLLGSVLGPISLAAPTAESDEAATVRRAIGSMPRLRAGDYALGDRLHAASSLSDLNLRRIKASKPGGTWRDWDESLVAACHSKASGVSYPSVYGRMEWDRPAPTITTQCFGFGNGRFGHPEQDRAISLREAAILQTFPPDYQFVGPGERVRFSVLGRLIGNAVPVRLGEVIGDSVVSHARLQAN